MLRMTPSFPDQVRSSCNLLQETLAQLLAHDTSGWKGIIQSITRAVHSPFDFPQDERAALPHVPTFIPALPTVIPAEAGTQESQALDWPTMKVTPHCGTCRDDRASLDAGSAPSWVPAFAGTTKGPTFIPASAGMTDRSGEEGLISPTFAWPPTLSGS